MTCGGALQNGDAAGSFAGNSKDYDWCQLHRKWDVEVAVVFFPWSSQCDCSKACWSIQCGDDPQRSDWIVQQDEGYAGTALQAISIKSKNPKICSTPHHKFVVPREHVFMQAMQCAPDPASTLSNPNLNGGLHLRPISGLCRDPPSFPALTHSRGKPHLVPPSRRYHERGKLLLARAGEASPRPSSRHDWSKSMKMRICDACDLEGHIHHDNHVGPEELS